MTYASIYLHYRDDDLVGRKHEDIYAIDKNRSSSDIASTELMKGITSCLLNFEGIR